MNSSWIKVESYPSFSIQIYNPQPGQVSYDPPPPTDSDVNSHEPPSMASALPSNSGYVSVLEMNLPYRSTPFDSPAYQEVPYENQSSILRSPKNVNPADSVSPISDLLSVANGDQGTPSEDSDSYDIMSIGSSSPFPSNAQLSASVSLSEYLAKGIATTSKVTVKGADYVQSRGVSPQVIIYKRQALPSTSPVASDFYQDFSETDASDNGEFLYSSGESPSPTNKASQLFKDIKSASLDSSVEKPRGHIWTVQESFALMVLHRYYETSLEVFTKILNKMPRGRSMVQNGVLRSGALRSKFAFLKQTRTWVELCHADMNEYEDWREDLETYAAMLDLNLRERTTRVDVLDEVTRTRSRSVKRVAKKLDILFQRHHVSSLLPPEYSSSADLGPSVPTSNGKTLPQFVYRCTNENSATIRDHRGIVPEAFGPRPSSNLGLEVDHDIKDALFQLFAGNHIWYHTRGSPFVSTSDSLFELFRRANKFLDSSVISVIRYDAIKDFSYPAVDVIRELRKSGDFTKMRYQGTCEYITLGCIPKEAIVKEFYFRDLQQRLNDIPESLPLLERLNPDVRVPMLRSTLFQDSIQLIEQTAGSLGVVAAAMGVDASSNGDFIEEIVSKLVDAFIIELNTAPKPDEIDRLLQCFVSDLLRNPDGTFKDLQEDQFEVLKHGFITGIVQGIQKLDNEKKKIERNRTTPKSNRANLRGLRSRQ